MTATLTFNLPEEQAEFDLACKGAAWSSAMWDLRMALRDKIKYGDQETFAANELLELIRSVHESNELPLE